MLCLMLAACSIDNSQETNDLKDWAMLPFVKVDSLNPIVNPDPEQKFFCPVRQDTVRWELKDVFNPAAVVKDGKVYMGGRYSGDLQWYFQTWISGQ